MSTTSFSDFEAEARAQGVDGATYWVARRHGAQSHGG